jgi:hypothetical protein
VTPRVEGESLELVFPMEGKSSPILVHKTILSPLEQFAGNLGALIPGSDYFIDFMIQEAMSIDFYPMILVVFYFSRFHLSKMAKLYKKRRSKASRSVIWVAELTSSHRIGPCDRPSSKKQGTRLPSPMVK